MFAALIVGIVVAAAAATSGLIGSIQADTEAYQKAQAQQNYLDEMYLLKTEKAEEEFNQAKEEAEKNAEYAKQNADLADLGSDIAEQGTSNDINTAIDNMYLSQANDAMQWNAAARQAGSAEGGSYAQLASSGVRAGSSLSDAVEMESATNAAQLQFSQDATRRSNDNNLASVLNGIANTRYNIMSNRVGADTTRQQANDLIASYAAGTLDENGNVINKGGSQWNLYRNNLAQLKKDRDYDWSQLEYEKGQHSGWNAFWNGFVAFNSQGAKGFSTGYNIGDKWSNAASSK